LEWTVLRGAKFDPASGSWVWRTAKRLVLAIGLSSYSLYLVHQPLIHWVYLLLPLKGALLGPVLKFALLVPVIMVSSYAMCRLLEMPSIRLGQRTRGRKHSSQ